MIRAAGRMLFHVVNDNVGGDLLRWPGLFLSENELNAMSVDDLKTAYERDFKVVVENSESFFRKPTYFAGVEALERCLLYLNKMSELADGPHGKSFINSCRSQLKKQAREIARRAHT